MTLRAIGGAFAALNRGVPSAALVLAVVVVLAARQAGRSIWR